MTHAGKLGGVWKHRKEYQGLRSTIHKTQTIVRGIKGQAMNMTRWRNLKNIMVVREIDRNHDQMDKYKTLIGRKEDKS